MSPAYLEIYSQEKKVVTGVGDLHSVCICILIRTFLVIWGTCSRFDIRIGGYIFLFLVGDYILFFCLGNLHKKQVFYAVFPGSEFSLG